jgi:creatinine amidohydrolase
LYPTREDWPEARRAVDISSSGHDDMHAGEVETSVLRAAQPNYLRDGWQSCDHTAADRRHLTTLGIDACMTTGVIAYPSRATAQKGQKILNYLSQAAPSLIPCSSANRPTHPYRGGYRPLTLPSAPTKS